MMKCPKCKIEAEDYKMMGCFIDGESIVICENCVEEYSTKP